MDAVDMSEDSLSSQDDDSVSSCHCDLTKRHAEQEGWNGIDRKGIYTKPKITWPPPNDQAPNTSWNAGLRNAGPVFGNRMQLFSKTNYNLAIDYDKVYGTQDDNDPHTFLEIVNAGRPGSVRIFGMLTNMYVCMDQKGRLKPEWNIMNEETVFEESLHGLYNTYMSLKYAHNGWYIGIKKSGKFKNGRRTGHKQKACLFLPRRGRFE